MILGNDSVSHSHESQCHSESDMSWWLEMEIFHQKSSSSRIVWIEWWSIFWTTMCKSMSATVLLPRWPYSQISLSSAYSMPSQFTHHCTANEWVAENMLLQWNVINHYSWLGVILAIVYENSRSNINPDWILPNLATSVLVTSSQLIALIHIAYANKN